MSILEEQRMLQSKEQMRLREKKLIRAKQKAYGEFVRKQVAPKVDPDKIDEVKERIVSNLTSLLHLLVGQIY